MEQNLEIVETKKGMKAYKNIYLKPYNQYAGLDIGNHVIVQSTEGTPFPIKTQYGEIFGIKLQYKGEEVGIVLNQVDLDKFNAITNNQAGVPVKITRNEITKMSKNGKMKQLIAVLEFSAA